MEEISLREYIEVMLKGKKLIAIITIACMVLGLVVGFVQPKKYEAIATILTNPINANTESKTDSTSLNGLINSMSQYPTMDISTYTEQFLSADVVTKTIQDLNLVKKDGSYISTNALRAKVKVVNPEKTNLLNVTVEDENAEMAAKIANKLSEYFSMFISDLNKNQGLKSSEAIATQMNVEKENLDKESQKMRDYLASSPSIEALQSEIDSLIAQLSEYKTSLNNIQSAIATDKTSLTILLNGNQSTLGLNVEATSVNIPTTGGDSTFQFNIDSSNKLQGSLLTMEITNTEIRLNSELAQEVAISDKITKMEAKLVELQSILADEQYKYNLIRRDNDLAQQTYNTYQEKYKEALITAASDIGRVSIQISSPAITPENPSNMSKIFVLAIAAVLGIMIGIFVVFFKEYWSTSEVTAIKKK